jgi:carboxypeptidase Q
MFLKQILALSLTTMTLCVSYADAKAIVKLGSERHKPQPSLSVEAQAIKLRDTALSGNVAYEFVSELTTRFGPRLAGSETERKAALWAADRLTAMGFENVRVQSFPLSLWFRGENEAIEITAPFPMKLQGVGLGQSTAGQVEAQAIMFDTYQEFLDTKQDLTGKIVVILQPMARTSTGSGYGRLSGTIRSKGPLEAQKRGAVGFVLRSLGSDDHRFAHTGTTTWQDGKGIPSMAISVPDATQLSRIKTLQDKGEAAAVFLKMTTKGRFAGMGTSQNVLAEITGSEKPDEIIVIGGHIDSWDLGTGAIDDGVGLAITLGALKAMIDQGLRPKRTLRLVFWGAEEVSQPDSNPDYGGDVYAKAQSAELSQTIFAAESDFGAGNIYAVTLPQTEDQAFVKTLGKVLAPLSIYIDAKGVPTGGQDTQPLHAKGVPAIDFKQDGYDYFDVHHTADDVLERIDYKSLNQNVAAWAASLWLIANSDVRFKAPEPAK